MARLNLNRQTDRKTRAQTGCFLQCIHLKVARAVGKGTDRQQTG